MRLYYKNFLTPRNMLQSHVVRGVVDFVNQCEFTQKLNGELNRAEYGWLKFIEGRIDFMVDTCPDFGGNMQKCLSAYKRILPRIHKLLQQ